MHALLVVFILVGQMVTKKLLHLNQTIFIYLCSILICKYVSNNFYCANNWKNNYSNFSANFTTINYWNNHTFFERFWIININNTIKEENHK